MATLSQTMGSIEESLSIHIGAWFSDVFANLAIIIQRPGCHPLARDLLYVISCRKGQEKLDYNMLMSQTLPYGPMMKIFL